MKRLVICCDGTWNTQDQTDGGIPAPTNVAKLKAAVLDEAPDGTVQQKYYHPGVGTDPGLVDKVLGGGIGLGLDQNIMSAYRNLCDHYESGDEIFLFGFSRGAYTVRSLGGLVGRCGLLATDGLSETEAWERIESLFQKGYRERQKPADWKDPSWIFHKPPAPLRNIPLRFIGVWDTVGALGIPDDLALLNLLDSLNDHSFYDTTLGNNTKTARHAIAIDELRASFQPTMWTKTANRDVKQLWFPGVHSDVGGGYAETGLADGALQWMFDEAAACDLAFAAGILAQIKPDHHGVLHNSLTGVFKLMPTQPRSTPSFGDGAEIHASAAQRHTDPPITQAPYKSHRSLPASGAALSVDVFAIEPWNATSIWLEKGVQYELSATGEWKDKSIPCGPAGTNDGKFHAGEVVHLLGSALGKLEGLFKSVGGNNQADFLMTKRHEELPWFCLTGAIANGGGVKANEQIPHETFAIGDGATIKPKKSGYLYAYANDAWRFYDNNRGKVRLTVTRR